MKSVLEGVSDVCWKRISDFLPAFSSVNRLINGGVSSLLFLSFLNFSGNDRGFCVSWKRSCGRSFGDYSGLLLTFAPLLCGSQVITGAGTRCMSFLSSSPSLVTSR